MKSKNLMIGNYVYDSDNVVIQILPSDISIIFKQEFQSRDKIQHQPIPLTEDWLMRLRFKKENDHIFMFPDNTSLRMWGFAWNVQQYSIAEIWDDIITPSIKHVHQLQNLYHALTGQHLTV